MQKWNHALTFLLALTLIVSSGLLPVWGEEEKVTILKENFDSYADESAAQSGLSKNWKIEDSSTWGKTDGFSLVDNNGGKALKMSWLGGRLFRAQNVVMPDAYEITFQAKGGSTTGDSGFFFLHTLSENYQVKKIFDTGTNAIRDAKPEDNIYISIFEDDGHKGSDFGNGVGYAGIYVKLHSDKLYIIVKTEESLDATYTKGIGNLRYAAPLPAGKNFDNGYVDIKIIEKDKTVSFYAGNTLLGSVVYSEQNGSFYTKAIILDASGKEVAKTERAKINGENILGFSTRGGTMYLDNIQIDSLTGAVSTLQIVPIYDDKEGTKGDAIPFTYDTQVAFRVTAKAGDAFKSVTYKEMPTFEANGTSFQFSVFKWQYDYETTIDGEPVYETKITDHKDNQDCTITFPEPLGSGHYLVVVWEGEEGQDDDGYPKGQPGVWKHSVPTDSNILVFYNGMEEEYGLFVQCVMIENGDPNGTVEDLDATPTPDSSTLTPTPTPTEKPKESTPSPTPVKPADNQGSIVVWIVVAICAVVIAGAVVFIVLKRKKKS